jgi:hypothetical protein
VILERRSRTLLELSQELPRAHNCDLLWDHAIQVLSRNSKDVPFALFYSTDPKSGSLKSTEASSPADGQHECTLRGSIGLPETPPVGLTKLDLRQDHGFIPYFKQAVLAQKPITVSLDRGFEATQFARDIQWQGFGGICRAVVVCALHPPSSKDIILGYMVLGLSKYLRKGS